MIYRKNERKRHNVCAILTIGALAAIGAISIAKSGKEMLNCACNKVKCFFKKESSCACPTTDCKEE